MTTNIPAGVPAPTKALALTAAEFRVIMRDTAGFLIPLGLPVILLAAMGMNETYRETVIAEGFTIVDLFLLPSSLIMVVAFVGLTNLPSFLTTYRRGRVLRTLAVTPIHPGTVLLAQTFVSVVQTLAGVTLVLAVAIGLMGAAPPQSPALAALAYALGAAAMIAVGLLIAAVAPSTNTAIAMGMAAFFAFGALGGMFGPTDTWPTALRVAGEFTPYGATTINLRAAWLGDGLEVAPTVTLLVTTLVAAALALRLYRWR